MIDDSSSANSRAVPASPEASSSSKPKRSGTFIYPLPSTPLPNSTPMTGTTGVYATGTRGAGTPSTDSSATDSSATDGSATDIPESDPAGGVGAGITNEGTSSVTSTSTSSSTNLSTSSADTGAISTALASDTASTTDAAGVPARRNSMGVASVRIAARLAGTELTSRSSRTVTDPTLDNDELLRLLGEYLVAGGLEKPEIHATLAGQSIVVDLLKPHRQR